MSETSAVDLGASSALEDLRALRLMGLQAATVALSLTLNNLVAEQQQAQVLRLAITASVTQAVLAGRVADAERLLGMLEPWVAPKPEAIVQQVRLYLETMDAEFARSQAAG